MLPQFFIGSVSGWLCFAFGAARKTSCIKGFLRPIVFHFKLTVKYEKVIIVLHFAGVRADGASLHILIPPTFEARTSKQILKRKISGSMKPSKSLMIKDPHI